MLSSLNRKRFPVLRLSYLLMEHRGRIRTGMDWAIYVFSVRHLLCLFPLLPANRCRACCFRLSSKDLLLAVHYLLPLIKNVPPCNAVPCLSYTITICPFLIHLHCGYPHLGNQSSPSTCGVLLVLPIGNKFIQQHSRFACFCLSIYGQLDRLLFSCFVVIFMVPHLPRDSIHWCCSGNR